MSRGGTVSCSVCAELRTLLGAEKMPNNSCAFIAGFFPPSFVKTCHKFSYNQSRFKLNELCLGERNHFIAARALQISANQAGRIT